MLPTIAQRCCLSVSQGCLWDPLRLPIGATYAANNEILLLSSPHGITVAALPLGTGSAAYHHCLTQQHSSWCRGRITLHTRAGVDPDQLNFPLDDYTDEEIPDSIEALQDAIKLDQVSAKSLSAFASG